MRSYGFPVFFKPSTKHVCEDKGRRQRSKTKVMTKVKDKGKKQKPRQRAFDITRGLWGGEAASGC